MPSETPLLLCDLTQSYSPRGGGGISTYLREKREHVLAQTPHRLLQIVPGPEDRVVESGRHIWVEISARRLANAPNYRFILRTGAVRRVLEQYRPDVIESLCPWLLPWSAIHHRQAHPHTALVGGYRTDFPNAQIHRVASKLFGTRIAAGARRLATVYAARTYREFDRVYVLGEQSRRQLADWGITDVDMLSLGVDAETFAPRHRDPQFRARLGLPGSGPLLVYAGRMDHEKRVDRLVEMMRLLPAEFGAALVMIGDGRIVEGLKARAQGLPIAFRGFLDDRQELARALASSDIYVSAMADETFGVSVLEAQACGLPVVGVASGAMTERVVPGVGLLAPVDDVAAMARHVEEIWQGDRAGMSRAARQLVVGRYSWPRTFEHLFTEIYPAALARAHARAARLRPTWPQELGANPDTARLSADPGL